MTILITGATRGIGAGLMSAYAASGRKVLGTSRSDPIETGLLPLDLSHPDSIRALPEHLGYKKIDLLICNAGVYLDKGNSLDTGFSPEIWGESFAVNVTGVFLTIQSLLPQLRRGQTGKIAILSSIMASQERAPGGSYVYRASKAAVLNLGRNLAVDLASQGISVGIYHPGWVRTNMGSSAADISVDEAVGGLIERFDELGPETSGCYLSYDGSPIPF